MLKPNNFEKVLDACSIDVLRPGGHRLSIKQVVESSNQYGEDMIIVQFDCADQDDQPGHFKKMFQRDDRVDKKWPYAGTSYISLVDGFTGNCSRPFANFADALMKSNPGFEIDWEAPDWARQFVGLKIGGVFGKVEHEWNDEVQLRIELRWFCNIDHVDTVAVPKVKLLKPTGPVERALRKTRPVS